MNKADAKLIRQKQREWLVARTATAIFLRADTRYLGVPKLREKIEELAALQAIGSRTTSVGRDAIAAIGDNVDLYTEGLPAAKAAAVEAIMAANQRG